MLLLAAGCTTRIHVGDHDAGSQPAHDGGGVPDGASTAPVPCGPTECTAGAVCCNASCGICTAPGLGCAAIACVETCTSNGDCDASDYCATPRGTCGDEGTCVPRPTACTDHIETVCGCDGTTYGNPCEANAAGSSVASAGTCESCGPQDAAAEGLCLLDLGARWNGTRCEALGGCRCVGEDCDALYPSLEACETAHQSCVSCEPQDAAGTGDCDAVVGVKWDGAACVEMSGCECTGADCGATYVNVSVCAAAHGACNTCSDDGDCDGSERCYFPAGQCGRGGPNSGECRPIPGELPCPVGAPTVCGCDATTYDCAAQAEQVGVSVLFDGACERCGGVAGATCTDVDDYCYYPDRSCGLADEPGVCMRASDECHLIIDPVCGCDGHTYDNACLANLVGGVDTAEETLLLCSD